MKKLMIATMLIVASIAGFCQYTTVTGKVMNASKDPLQFANIAVVDQSDFKTVKGALTDSLGNFLLEINISGKYKLVITNAGYAVDSSNNFTIDAATTAVQIPDIILTAQFKTAKEVVIQTKKKFIEIQADKTVLNVENSIVAVGNSAFEVIKKAPAVTVDKDDNLKLKGGIATIYVDGKPFYLSRDQLTQYLKNLQAEAISKIEIIGNPSSKYDAAGLTGIINIRLKKNKQFGTNGNVTIGTGYGRYPKANTALSLNHRTKAVNIFTDGSLGYSESFNKLTYNSIISSGNSFTAQSRDNYWHPKTTWHSFKAGADFTASNKTIIGILIKGNGDDMKAITDNQTIFSNQNNQKLQSIITQKDDQQNTSSISYNINLKTTLDSAGSELVMDADYVTYNRTASNINYNNFYDANENAYRSPYTFRNGSPADINIKTAKADFTKVYSSSFKIETGAKYSTVQNNNYLKVDSLNSDKNWTVDYNRTNTFIYAEKIAAGYFNFTKDWKKVSLQTGLRLEHTDYTGNSVTLQQVRDSNYTNLFPSVFVTYRHNEKNTWNISYSRRINRPSYQSLNPFIDFIDPFTQFEGNPNLRPSFTQSFELKHSYNNFLYSSLSYSYTSGQSTNVILQNKVSGAVRNISANVGNSSYISLNFSASVEPYKWWTIDNNISFSGGNSSSTYPDYEFNQNFLSSDISCDNSFKLPNKLKAQLSLSYSTPYRDGITRVRSYYAATAGLQKSLWDGKAIVKINYNNFIGQNAYRAKYLSSNLNIDWRNQWEGRRVAISFNYKFGNSNVKASRQRKTASEAEKNRVNL